MKKFLSVLFVVIFLFGSVSVNGTLKNVLGTEASALDKVSGSYDYLVKYIKMNGVKSKSGDLEIYVLTEYKDAFYSKEVGTKTGYEFCCAQYDKKEDRIALSCFGQYDYTCYMNDCKKVIVTFFIEKDGKSYPVLCSSEKLDGSKEEQLYTTIDPLKYNNGALTYSIVKTNSNTTKHKSELCKQGDSIIKMSIGNIDEFLRYTVGFGLGNFGFTKISKTASVPKLDFFDKISVAIKIALNAIKALFTFV